MKTYNGEGYLTIFGHTLRVEYNITIPLWGSGGMCIKFLDELSHNERHDMFLEDDEVETEWGDNVDEYNWVLKDLEGEIVLFNKV